MTSLILMMMMTILTPALILTGLIAIQKQSTCNKSPVYLGAAAIAVSALLPLARALHTWAEPPAAVLNHPQDSYN
jgi:hypothetical protein